MSCISFLNTCPSSGDQETTLLAKILQVLNESAGVSSISVNGGPAETGAVNLTIPAATPALLNFTDENADADGVVWRNSGATEVFRTVGATGHVQFQGTATRLHSTGLTDSFTFLATDAKADGGFLEVYGTGHATGLGGATVSIHDGGQFRVRSAPVGSSVSRLAFVVNGTDGNVGIGQSTTPAGLLHINTETTALGLAIFEQASADTDAFDLSFRKARGTIGVPTVITTGDALGTVNFRGYSGAGGYVTSASVRAASSGTIASTRVGGRLILATATDVVPSVLTDRMIITDNGDVIIGPEVSSFAGAIAQVTTESFANNGAVFAMASSTVVPFTMSLAKARGTASALTAVSVGDLLGIYRFLGYSGAGGFVTSASIRAVATGTVATTRVPASLIFATGTDAAPTVLTDRMSIDNSAIVTIGHATVAQTLRIHETTNAAVTDYSRTVVKTQAGNHLIQTEAAGTGLSSGKPRTLQVGSGPSVGTDIAGTTTIIASGQSTGSGNRGGIDFQQSPPGGSGSGVNTLTTSWALDGSTNLITGTDNFSDLGKTGARPRNILLGGLLSAGGAATVQDATGIPAGGTAGAGYKFSSTANFGVFFGSGAPTLSAAKGSLYLRSDGSGTTNRAYINTNGATTWTAITTSA